MTTKTYLVFNAVVAFGALLTGCQQSGSVAAKDPGATKEPITVTSEPPVPKVRTVTVPSGTALSVRTLSSVSTKDTQNGETVRATLAAPLTVNGVELAPRGADVSLLVAGSDEGGRVKGRAMIGLRLASMQIAGEPHQVVSNTYWREAPGTKKKDAATVGVITGVGAAIGAIADGGRGAAIGAASGAGAGTGVVLATRGAPAVIPAESVLQFNLQQPISVTLKR